MIAGAVGADDRVALKYPEAPRSETVDDYHGSKIADPYRPLEDPDSPATRAWVEAENRGDLRLPGVDPAARGDPQAAHRALGLREVQPAHAAKGGRYFFSYNTGLQNQSVLYTTRIDRRPGRGCCSIPTRFRPTGPWPWRASRSARTADRWPTGSPRPARTGTSGRSATSRPDRTSPTEIKWIKFSGAEWSPDGQGFFYGRFPEPRPGEDLKGANYYQKVYYHRLGTAGRRPLIWEDPEHKEWRAVPQGHRRRQILDPDDREGHGRQVPHLLSSLDQPRPKPVHLVGDFDAELHFIDNDGPVFWFKTNKDAPRGKVVAIDIRNRTRSTGSS